MEKASKYISFVLPECIVNFVKKTAVEYNIDESHGVNHSYRVFNYARLILIDLLSKKTTLIEGQDNTTSIAIILVAAFVHDMCDKKYIDESIGISRIRDHLAIIYENKMIDDIVSIITKISYSKRLERLNKGLPMIDNGDLQLATEIVCDADMLDAYLPERCLTYQNFHNPGNDEINRRYAKNLLKTRVLQYRDKFLNTEKALELAIPLHHSLEIYILVNMSDVDD